MCAGCALRLFSSRTDKSNAVPEHPAVSTFVMQVTIWWVPLVGWANGLGHALNAAYRERQHTAFLMITTIISLICLPIIISQFGVLGA
jgi:hypothetical protein